MLDDWPATAEELMRSRFSAFREANVEWLRSTWHESTRPDDLDLAENPRWRGLQIIETVDGRSEDLTGIVEFRATYVRHDGSIGVLQERSRFVNDDGRWYYVDGDIS